MPIIQDNLNTITEFIVNNKDRIDTNLKLSDVLEDDLVKHIDQAMQMELSKQPYTQARPRLSPVNIGRKIIQKLSTLYIEGANRDLTDKTDQDLWEYYAKSMDLDVNMADANSFYNTHKYTALEPYVSKNKEPRIRIIPADRFLVWNSGFNDNPSEPEVFIKFMGEYGDGKASFQLWSDEEVVVVDIGGKSDARVPTNIKTEIAVRSIDENPYGKIPFIYITKSKYRIMPSPDEALFGMSVLIPVLLTDLNFISKFQSFAMLYTIDVDVNNLQMGASNMYNFKSDPTAGAKPQVGVLSPNANIDSLGQSIVNQLSMFLETRNLKATTAGKATVDSSSSGIALMIRNIDTSEDRKMQAVIFKSAERQLLSLISTYMHPVWILNGEVSDLRSFSSDPQLTIKYAEANTITTEQERIDNALSKRDNGLTTQKMALSEVHPDLNDQDIDVLSEEIKDEQQSVLEFRQIDSEIDTEIPEQE